MSNYTSLNAYINANIKQNGKREITGRILNAVLNAMVNTLGTGYQFAGVATTATNPGSPDAKVFYIANGKGTYTNFGGIEVTEDEVVVLYYDTEWHKVSTGIASQAKLSELQTTIDSKQDTISDLDDIREGAELGKTALQEHQDISGLATKKEVATKQDKISDLATIREGAAKGATALQSYTETDPIYTADKPSIALKSEIPDISGKQDKISDLDTIREGAAKGATALQSYTETDPIYSADKPSLALKSELDGKQDKLTAGDNITIVNNVISSTGGGGGSVDLSAYAKTEDVNAGLATKQDTLIAGNGIIIKQNVISATGGSGGGGSVDLSEYAKTEDVNAGLATKQDKISDLATIREGAAKGATALQSETDPIYSADKPSLALKSELNGKQDTISDLDDIREGAALGKTALQEHQDISKLATKEEVATKQDTISDLATIRSGAAKGATALQSYTETDPIYTADKPSIALKSEIPDISGKQDTISDLATIRSGAAKGATALQSYTETDPVYMADKPSLALKSEIPDISGKADKSELSSVATSGSYNDLINKPTIPSKTSELTNDSGYLNSIPSEYVTETELDSKGYLTEHQDISGKEDKYTSVTSSSGTIELSDTKMYILGEQSSVTITLPSGAESNGREYLCQFTASASGCTLSVPDIITWLGGETPTINAGKTYQLSIVNNLAVIGEF